MRIRKALGWFAALIMIPIIILFSFAAIIEPNWIEVTHHPVYISELPAEFEGFRIVQFSDLHGKSFSRNEISSKVNRLKPDIIVITGDIFDESRLTPIEYPDDVLDGLEAPYGVYFVFGNNEIYLDKAEVKERLAKMGIKTLVNERISIDINGKSISVAGIDDIYSMNGNLAKALEGAGAETKILLAHSPEIIYEAARYEIDLVLAGHTHGGQIAVPFLNWRLSNMSKGYEKFMMGLHSIGDTQIYVNRGLGENYINMRFLTRPEITVITLL